MIISFPSSAKLYACSTTPRVSASHSASTISHSVKSVGCGGARRRTRSSLSLLFCASNPWGTAEVLDERKSSSNAAAATPVVASSSASDRHDISPPRSFLEARSEQDILLVIQKEAEAGRLPINLAQGMTELYHNYRDALCLPVTSVERLFKHGCLKKFLLVLRSGDPKADEIAISNMAITLDRIFSDVQDPFQFSPYHSAIREPFDYYMFGQRYIRPLVDFRTSVLGNLSIFNEIEKKLEKGENVILMSNHQTEADPAVLALLLESTNPFVAENMIYVAGDRVLTDPLSKPFSMGRNLLCVYSKKHMNDDPELIDMKRKANTKSLKEMAMLLRAGSKIIWIAPSGGRDRPDPVTKEWHPAPFDASSVDNMRRLVEHAGVPGHIYPLAIMCHELMPPPLEVEKEIGERRDISFHGVGMSVASAVDYHKIYSALEIPDEAKSKYSELLYSSICQQYNVLKSAIYDKQGPKASTPTVYLTQPWL